MREGPPGRLCGIPILTSTAMGWRLFLNPFPLLWSEATQALFFFINGSEAARSQGWRKNHDNGTWLPHKTQASYNLSSSISSVVFISCEKSFINLKALIKCLNYPYLKPIFFFLSDHESCVGVPVGQSHWRTRINQNKRKIHCRFLVLI